MIRFPLSARMDRYNHDIGDDTDDTDDSPLFGSFSSYSPQSRKISQTRPPQLCTDAELDFTKKQLFRNDRPEGLLSPGFVTSAMLPSIAMNVSLDKNRSQTFARSVTGDTGIHEKTDNKLNTTSGSSATVVSADSHQATGVVIKPSNSNIISNSTEASCSLQFATPDSSQTESDDISPQIQRKRHTHSRDKLPRFSISVDDSYMWVILFLLKRKKELASVKKMNYC